VPAVGGLTAPHETTTLVALAETTDTRRSAGADPGDELDTGAIAVDRVPRQMQSEAWSSCGRRKAATARSRT